MLTSTSRSLSKKNARPTSAILRTTDNFVSNIAKSNVDDGSIDLKQLTVINADLQDVIKAYEKREEFKINEKMSERKRELDELIAKAEKNYADAKLDHERKAEALDKQLTENHRHLMEVQEQTLIQQLKGMAMFVTYHQQIIEDMKDLQNSIDAQSCWTSFFCCCKPKEISEKQAQIRALKSERELYASNNIEDLPKITASLMRRINADREKLLKQQEKLAMQQPQETAQLLRAERDKLQADINANREAYYNTISPQIMLNLVRLQSFAMRMQRKITNAKNLAYNNANAAKAGLLHAVLAIVTSFLEKFNSICQNFVCRPPQNQDNKISYAQYCARYHDELRLTELEKKSIIKGRPEVQVINRIFREHTPIIEESKSAPVAVNH